MHQSNFDAWRVIAVVCALLAATWTTESFAAEPKADDPTAPSSASDDGALLGIGYDRYEPTFYTGFAPRVPEPERIHLHLGRGNQLRITATLSDEVLRSYAADLLARYRTHRSLIDSGEIVLTQNTGFEAFEETVQAIALTDLVESEAGLADPTIRERNLELMERLNPGRVFRIGMPIDAVIRRWASKLGEGDEGSMDADRQVALANAMLPTRLYVRELDDAASAALTALVSQLRAEGPTLSQESLDRLRPAFVALLERVAPGQYPLRGDALEFVEFTAIHPVGSFNDYTDYRGGRIPMYPTPGRRALTTHQRTKTVDHIPTKVAYSYSPWIPYMHVGERLHNSFHTLWWQLRPESAAFLPEELRASETINRDGEPHQFLWLLSRGPMSHGCTHVNTGHILELRQVLPAQTERLYDVEVFLNKSHLYDVFDIDGDLEPEVMGVEYFVAYSLRDKQPHDMRAPTDRQGFYQWLYGGELRFEADGSGYFVDVMDAAFVDSQAVAGTTYDRIKLYEADYEPQKVQFFAPKPIPFVRELRKVGVDHPFSSGS